MRVFDGASGGPVPAPIPGLLAAFLPYGFGFTGGVYLAAGDILVPDGHADLIVAPGAGTDPSTGLPPPVIAYHGATGLLLGAGHPYPNFAGGVRVAMADVSGDGRADLLTVPGPGRTADVRVYSGADFTLVRSFSALGSFTGGAFVTAGDSFVFAGRAEIVVTPDRGADPTTAQALVPADATDLIIAASWSLRKPEHQLADGSIR